ncbi:MAG: flagellar hook-length control protein FliK [Burkholderiaceae bacterium]
MQVTAPAAPVTAPAQANAGKNAEASRAAFASLLQQSRSAQAPAPEAPAPGADPAAEADGADAPATPNTPFKARLKLTEKTPPPRPAEHGPKTAEGQEANREGPADEQANTARARRTDAPAIDPSLAPWLAASQPAPSAFEIPAARRAASEADDTPAGSSAAADGVAGAKANDASAVLQHKSAADTTARLETAAASQEALAAWSQSARADSAAAQRVVQPVAEDIGRSKAGAPDTITNAAALGAAAFNPLLGTARESSAPLTVNLPTPLASPEFAQTLGVQMSVLAADGVQSAELQLNPAEMGPVSVQIVIDGTNARVDFGADLAATRQVIEAGMPELAGALRDAGFTLAGGGVSQHAGGRSDSSKNPADTGDGAHRGREAESQALQPAPRRRNVTAGGVDLYA